MTPTNLDILELLQRMDKKNDKLIERLLGDLDNENPQARLPRLEAASTDQEDRITGLEGDRIKIYTFASVISGVVAFLADWLHKH